MTVGWNDRISNSVLANLYRPGSQVIGTSAMLPKTALFSGLALETVFESLSPSSIVKGSSVPAADFNTGLPLFAGLVKAIRSIPELGVIQGKRSWPTITTLKTPDGSNSRINSEMRNTVSELNGEGLRTTVSPVSNAGNTFPNESLPCSPRENDK